MNSESNLNKKNNEITIKTDGNEELHRYETVHA